MAIVSQQPTSNTTPDAGQGGLAVTGASNTGHGATTASETNGASQVKTCIWTGFAAASGTITAVTLKVDWTESGTTEGGGRQFKVEYSLNGGAAWSTLFDHNPLGPLSGTASASLSIAQDLTQVRVRDKLQADSIVAAAEVVTGTVSGIRIEVETSDNTTSDVIVMW